MAAAFAGGAGGGAVLHDGVLSGSWRLDRAKNAPVATLVVRHVRPLTARARSSLAAEGRRLLRFMASDAGGHDVRFVAVD
jgi:hypothetical protein